MPDEVPHAVTLPPTPAAPIAPVPAPSFSWNPLTFFNSLSPGMRHIIAGVLTVVLSMFLTWLAGKLNVPVPPTPVIVPIEGTQPKAAVDVPASFAMGWVDDKDAIRASHTRRPPVMFAETPAGKAAMMGDAVADTFLWKNVREAAGKPVDGDWYPNVNQKDVGCCVGCGWKHSADVCQAVKICTEIRAARPPPEFKPLSVEVIYGLSRVNIGKGELGNSDGSMGAWAREAVRDWGVCPMDSFPSGDLTTFDPYRARLFGSKGVPSDMVTVAKDHPVKATALVKTWAEVQKSIVQGYPVAVCSNVGFQGMNRDKDGFISASGSWPHCMCIIGIRGGNRPGGFILNSWGDDAHKGPVWPAAAPKAGFWVDAKTVERMVSQGDSYSLADLAGFPARQLDWGINAAPAKQDEWIGQLRQGERHRGDPRRLLHLAP